MPDPKVSIITVNYNNREGLEKTMRSVFTQSFTDYEYLIIDGDSNDGAKELIADYSDRLEYWVSEPDGGIYDAMNKGIEHANGSYIMFLNSGDYLLKPDVLQNSFAIINRELLDVYYGDIEIEFADKRIYIQKHAPVLNLNFLENRTLNHQASFIKKTLFRELGLYNTHYKMAADYAFYLKAFIIGKRFKYIDDILVHYPWDGVSSKNMDKYILEMKAVWKDIVPGYIDLLYRENRELKHIMNRVFIRIGKRLDEVYQSAKALIKKDS